MKKILFFLVTALLSFSSIADYSAEKSEIDKFEKNEFTNVKNYLPFEPGMIPDLTPEFQKKLTSNPKLLKYFFILITNQRMHNRYKVNKAFALNLENKFGGKTLTAANWAKVQEAVGNYILDESEITLKEVFKSPDLISNYFEANMKKLGQESFK